MRILSIETSCDETGISILEAPGAMGAVSQRAQITVLSDVLVSQASIHAEFGGVFPAVARREHAKAIIPLLINALGIAGLVHNRRTTRTLRPKEMEDLSAIFHKEPELFETFKKSLLTIEMPDIDAIAVTSGPGLEPALWVGINTAQALGLLWKVPVIPVNHMEGHIMASLIIPKPEVKGKKVFALSLLHYPSLALLISGGHTELVLMSRRGSYEILGQTRDDAVGEAFDKVARMLGLPYPGGPEISKLAMTAPASKTPRYPLPRPMLKSPDFDFSFAGLKTAVLYTLKNIINPTPEDKASIAKEFEDSVTEILIKKTLAAAKKYNVHEIILGGGVTANNKIRVAFQTRVKRDLPGVTLFIPSKELSTDNGLMIALVGLVHSNKQEKTIIAEGHLRLSKNARPTIAELRKKK